MRLPLVAANWKMHGSSRFVDRYIRDLQAGIKADGPGASEVEVAVFPPFVYLQRAVAAAGKGIVVGAQNLSQETGGAFTGEVSAEMLADCGCQMVLVGHSERRTLYGESSRLVAEKFQAALSCGLTPVLCVGETLAQREQDKTLEVIEEQLRSVIDVAGLDSVVAAVVAYEPVWAIGTGKTASPEQAQEVHAAIRAFLGAAADQTRILYGGSVKAANAEALFSQPDIDGGLVGGASLDAGEFSAICERARTN